MRIAICDDDEQELAQLSKLVAEYQSRRKVKSDCRIFYNGSDLLRNMKGGEYDLIFLDVLMPGINGIQIARELRDLDQNVKLVFISSSPNFALESYNIGAFHYLLKPANADSLFPLLDKVEYELSRQDEYGFLLQNRKGIVRISYAELEYTEVINKKLFFYLTDGTVYETTAALSEYEERLLTRPEFIKTHRSYLANLSRIQSVDIHSAVTKSRRVIPISRSRHHLVRDAYMKFIQQSESGIVPDIQEAVSVPRKHSPGPWQILLVDDDPSDRAFWSDILQRHGCIVHQAENGETALKLAADRPYDCILLDVMIPGEDGFSVCERLHKLVHTPVIFLSCVTESDRQVAGFAAGGIDYITKDTPAELFWAKVETRIKLALSDRTQLCFGPLLLDLTEHKALMDGKELLLTSVEFDILQCLSEHMEHIFTPEEIFHMIWMEQPWDGGQTVQMHMSRLRQKLEKAWEEHHFIETVWGKGYRFVPAADHLN